PRYSPHARNAGKAKARQTGQNGREMRERGRLSLAREVAPHVRPPAEVAMRVPQFLNDQRVCFETVLHPPSYTAQKLAKHLHISGRQVAKSVLLASETAYYLAVLPAARRVELGAVSEHLGVQIRLAGEHEVVRLFSDCEWGAVTPFGHLYGL